MLKRIILAAIVSFAISACQSTPQSPSGDLLEIKYIDISPQDIGQHFLWGGEILEIKNLKNTTELKVLGYMLDEDRQPKTDTTSTGRFITVYSGFLEPTDYRKGRLISVNGTLVGIRSGEIAGAEYEFPVLSVGDLRLHKQKPQGFNIPFSIGIGVGFHR